MAVRWSSFALGFTVAAVATGAAGAWLVKRTVEVGEEWVLPRRYFADTGDLPRGNGSVLFSGSIGGKESMAYPYNIFQGRCDQVDRECRTEAVQKIGDQQLSSIDTSTFRVTTWTPDLIVAESGENSPMCVTISLRIRRPEKVVEYIRSPKPRTPDAELCQAVERRTMVWTIEEPPGRRS